MSWSEENESQETSAEEALPTALLQEVFHAQLLSCLEECAHGRRGLFTDVEHPGSETAAWPEAARLRELAFALQQILAQAAEAEFGGPAPLCDQFLDLCSMHGESDPGEARLARAFLAHIAEFENTKPG